MNELIKVAAIAGGLWLLVKHTGIPSPVATGDGTPPPTTTPPSSTAPPSSTTAPPPSSTTPPTTTPSTTAPNQPTPSTAPLPTTDREAIARLAAAGNTQAAQQAETLQILYSADEWNWLRAAGGGGFTTTDLFPAGTDRTVKIGIRDYLARRTAAGLSGFRRGWRARR